MIIKKFEAQTEQDAILQAKKELGKDAIITNIKTINPRGIYKLFKKTIVEVTAAVDDTINYNNEKLVEKLKEVQLENKKEAQLKEAQRRKDIITEEQEIKKEEPKEEARTIEQKLNELQSLLQMQMLEKEESKEEIEQEEEEETNHNMTCMKLIYNQMLNNEVDEKYINQIISEIEKSLPKGATVDTVLASVYQKIILKLGQPKTIEIEEGKPKYIFFIGPTGVGKTTTIAKVASSYMLSHKARIAMVTSDTYRIAAVEQLKTYANILGVPLYVVYSGEELLQKKKDLDLFDLIFIDTAGRSHKNREQKDDIKQLISAIPEEEREVYLVLSATTKYLDLIKIAESYLDITGYNLLFTKLDETNAIGNILNVKMLTKAPLSYTTWGQNVPDDIGKIDAQEIAKQLLGGND